MFPRTTTALVLLLASSAHAQHRWPRAPLTEIARAQVGATTASERYGLSGAGTVLCAIDTGLDVSHRDFGTGRVLYWLDAHGTPRGAYADLEERFGGAVWRGDDLTGVPGDAHGHGTAITSVAIGDGSATDAIGEQAGIAPRASVIVVDAWDESLGGFPDEAVLRGVRFCRAVREMDGSLERMVVLLSLGGHDGAHDGTGALERALDEQARDLPIVVASGNDGEHAVHATGSLFDGERSRVDVRVPRSDRLDAALALTIRSDNGFAIEPPDGPRSEWISSARELDLEGAHVVVEEVAAATWRITLSARDGALASGTYSVELVGPTTFEVWLAGARLGSTFLPPAILGPHASASEQIAIPATASGVIAVGATVSRASTGMLMLEGSPGDPASFTSLGPSASGMPRPDVAAPGGWTLAALSSQVRDGDLENLAGGSLARYRADDGRIAVRGTSVSAAVVAGALLLALEMAPSTIDARDALIASARGDGAWRPDVGFGEIDVLRLLEVWSGARGTTRTHAAVSGTRPFALSDTELWLTARALDDDNHPAGELLTVALDDRSWSAPLHTGTASLAIEPTYAAVGTNLVVRAWIDGTEIEPALVPVVLDRSARGAAQIGGGCSIAGRTRSTPLFFFAGLLLVLLSGARRQRGVLMPFVRVGLANAGR